MSFFDRKNFRLAALSLAAGLALSSPAAAPRATAAEQESSATTALPDGVIGITSQGGVIHDPAAYDHRLPSPDPTARYVGIDASGTSVSLQKMDQDGNPVFDSKGKTVWGETSTDYNIVAIFEKPTPEGCETTFMDLLSLQRAAHADKELAIKGILAEADKLRKRPDILLEKPRFNGINVKRSCGEPMVSQMQRGDRLRLG